MTFFLYLVKYVYGQGDVVTDWSVTTSP